jgi:hypothetical protein
VPEAEVRSLDLAAFQRAADHHIHGYAHAFTRDEASYAASARVLEDSGARSPRMARRAARRWWRCARPPR